MTAQAHGRELPLRARIRVQPVRTAAKEAEREVRQKRGAVLARQRRLRRLLDMGAACFPLDREQAHAMGGAGETAESAIEHVMLQSASDAQAPPVAVDKQLHRTSPAVRRLLSSRRGANALLDEAISLGQLAQIPTFTIHAPTYKARPLCSVCGYWGDIKCMACLEPCCSKLCVQTHAETRCERPMW
ncbi:hypothetical protein Malapachy_3288 [Malassezia pachydermatis]|uniref:HIT-type domain-containing protein n=1 Tax=Malassezia pachydermatis TaxID=77020 RepID=A0A0M9VR96_9BASI|nr:hypothetical protein Malapachy_3288 [Malassezia pachydermatis]KOS16389.1 hypothetical protein Malapachy_3288 [Malassezia pachydermatis]